jgi:hypothetical protein
MAAQFGRRGIIESSKEKGLGFDLNQWWLNPFE